MANPTNKSNDRLRTDIVNKMKAFFEQEGEEILVTGNDIFCLPLVNDNGDEVYVEISAKIKRGTRGGEPYDGHHEADCYAQEAKLKAEKAAEVAAKKAKKIEADKKNREILEARKNEREKNSGK